MQRKDMRDVLIRPHDDYAPCLPVDAAHCKDVVTALDVGAEHLLVIVKAMTSLPGQKQRWHGLNGELTMRLLEHCADIDHRVDILVPARIFLDGRVLALCKKIAQATDAGACSRRIARSGKGEDPKAPIRCDDVAEVNRLGV